MTATVTAEIDQSSFLPRRRFAAYASTGARTRLGDILVHTNSERENVNDLHVPGEVFALTVPNEDVHVGYDLLEAAADALAPVPLTRRADDSAYTPFERRLLAHLPIARPTT